MSTPALIRALLCQTNEYTPIWLMRQAGRYLPEYRQLRSRAKDFMALCQNAELACEITLQPLARYKLDAAIIFSDILTIPDAMGLGLHFITEQGPCFHHPIEHVRDIDKLEVPCPEEKLAYVLDAITLVRQTLTPDIPLIGFCGSPWTIAAYMVQGHANKQFPKLFALAQTDAAALHRLLSLLSQAVIAHLNAQIRRGADVVMLFDTWGSLLTPEQYRRFSLPYLQQIIDHLIKQQHGKPIPSIVFAKGCHTSLTDLAALGCNALGIDEATDLTQARKLVGDTIALQGNLAPEILYQSPEVIINEVKTILRANNNHPGHVFNLGHGIRPDMSPEHVGVLIDAVHEFSKRP